MKLLLKRMSYKILVIAMITVVLSFFSTSSVSEAKLKLKEGEFYYSGTQEGTYVVKKGFWENLLNALGEIANYLLGIMILPVRGVIVGWVEIMEIILTAILGVETDLGAFFSDAIAGMDSYSQQIVNVESIIFNRVPILNANIFEGNANEEIVDNETGNEVVTVIRESVAKWYYIMRLIVIAFMLLLLIFIGIKMAISTIASEKAVYKQMLMDWLAGMIIVFAIHYIMIGILTINDTIVDSLEPLAKEPPQIVQEYQYGDIDKLQTSAEVETTLYESARTRAYSLKLTDGFTGMVIYAVLVYYAWRFALIYFRRVINIIMLTLLAPAVAASYAFNKVLTGKAKIFSTWFLEYIMNVVIQIVHTLVYVSFVSTALALSLISLAGAILAFVLLNFMIKADKLIRKLFKLSGGKGSLAGDMADRTDFGQLKKEAKSLKGALVGGTVATAAMKATYGIATKPIKAAGMAALSGGVAAFKNKQEAKAEKEKEKERREAEEKEIQEEEGRKKKKEGTKEEKNAEAYLKNNKEAMKNMEDIAELEEKKEKLLKERKAIKEEKTLDKKQQQDKLNKNQEELNKINKEIKKKEDAIEKAFLTEQIMNGEPILATIKGNLATALNGLVVKGKDGKYRSRKVPTVREGGVKGAIWRKKVNSKSLVFKNNMKLNTLLGLDSGEAKVLKAEMNFWKGRITALASLVAGTPLFVTNPLVGMALLSNAGITHLDVKTRKRRYKNRAARLENKSYTFSSFGAGATARLSRPMMYHVLEMDQLETLKHKKVRKEVKKVMNWEKEQQNREKSVEKKTKELKETFSENMYHYENNIKQEASEKSAEDLAFEQKVNQKNVVNVGDGVCMQLHTNIAMKKFMDKVEAIDAKSNLSVTDKIHMIQKEMDEQKGVIIKEAITTLCGQQGITDITAVQLTDADMVQINQNILGMLETQGITKKGDIDLESANINEESISEVYLDLTANHEETNKELEANLVSTAILEYMESKGEKNVYNLNTEEAKQEIYNRLKDKLMPNSSKKSASVIEKLTGKDKIKEDFELPEEIKESVEENIKKVKKIRKRRVGQRRTKEKISSKRSKKKN